MSALSPMPQDRPSIEHFVTISLPAIWAAYARLSQLGANGWRSDDEHELDDIERSHYEGDAIEVDPTRLGGHALEPKRGDYTMHAISALTCGTFSFLLMQRPESRRFPAGSLRPSRSESGGWPAPQIGSGHLG